MKRTFLLLAALLLFTPLRSQEADGEFGSREIIPRLDAGPSFSEGETSLGWYNSNLYTKLELAPSEHISFTLVNHWLTAPYGNFWESQADLYKGLGCTQSPNWVDFAHVDFTFGGWSFGLGKDCISIGSTEFDPWDWEQYYPLTTEIWNNFCSYQWGASVGYTTPSERTSVVVSARTSPYGERPFSSGLYAFSAGIDGSYGPVWLLWQAALIEKEKGVFEPVFSLGQSVELGQFELGFSWVSRVGDEEELLAKGSTFRGCVDFRPSDKWAFNATAIRETGPVDGWKAGLTAAWSPLENLKIHAAGVYNTAFGEASIILGCIYNLHIPFKNGK